MNRSTVNVSFIVWLVNIQWACSYAELTHCLSLLFVYFLSPQYRTMESTYLHPGAFRPATNAGDGVRIFIIRRSRLTTHVAGGSPTRNIIRSLNPRPGPVDGGQDAHDRVKTSCLDLRPFSS